MMMIVWLMIAMAQGGGLIVAVYAKQSDCAARQHSIERSRDKPRWAECVPRDVG